MNIVGRRKSSLLTRAAKTLSSPALWTEGLNIGTPSGTSCRHFSYSGMTPPPSGDYQVGDRVHTDVPLELEWDGWIFQGWEASPPWIKFGPLDV